VIILQIFNILLLSVSVNAQEVFTEQQMYQKTSQAVAKFYGLDVIGSEAARRIQEKYLAKEYQPYVPYFLTLHEILINKRIVFRKEW
jgi:hypothetical protein